jgi:hypothetical protein
VDGQRPADDTHVAELAVEAGLHGAGIVVRAEHPELARGCDADRGCCAAPGRGLVEVIGRVALLAAAYCASGYGSHLACALPVTVAGSGSREV